AVSAARKSFPEELANWADLVPFFVPLRQFTNREFPTPDTFAQLTIPSLAGAIPLNWSRQQLEAGRALILIDGVDELPKAQRSLARSWVEDLVGTYPACYFVITSRPAAVKQGWLEDASFDDAELQPMDIPDVLRFIEHWHGAIRQRSKSQEEQDGLDALEQNMRVVLENNRSIRNLATSPLLCAALCALHRDRHQQLPSDRIELYEACLYMLLDRRDRERSVLIETNDYPSLTFRQKRVLLEHIAYFMMRNSLTMLEASRFDRQIEVKLQGMERVPITAHPADLRRLFVERSGILREPIVHMLDFTHKTFQEFLCARAVMEVEDTGFLLERANDDQWHEVIILAAGMGSRQVSSSLIQGLIDRGDEHTGLRQQYHILAVACLETAVEIDPDTKVSLLERLERLIPPQNVTEARAIASAGDMAVPLLYHKASFKSPEAAAAVRALALIGTASAESALTSYRRESRQLVVRELLRASATFPSPEFRNKVIAQLRPTKLRIDRPVDLEQLGLITSLRELDAVLPPQTVDISPLRSLRNLTSLELRAGENITDITPVANFQQLTRLSLSWFPRLKSLSPLSDLPHLHQLLLDDVNMLADLEPLTSVENLNFLWLWHLPKAEATHTLKSLTKLSHLYLGFLALHNVEFVERMTDLWVLNLHSVGITDLEPLQTLSSLRQLAIAASEISDFSPVRHLTQLEMLSLREVTSLTDLQFLDSLQQLSVLEISGSPNLSNLHPLGGLTGLRRLTLRNCGPELNLEALQELPLIHIYINRFMYKNLHIPEGMKSRVHFTF
ncbi:MAG TPA: NACHT domain-containing protein, partial [Longimicrobium sp.]|nr:NACHT domain-containing protein [Longimicrobium sp.]